MFVALAREGWVQKLVSTPRHPIGTWHVFWLELLQDGKLTWFDAAAKKKADFRWALIVVDGRVGHCTEMGSQHRRLTANGNVLYTMHPDFGFNG